VSEAQTPGASAPGTKKSKPSGSWRGYLREYAIIVVGVLTALAAQQAAEWLHWRSEVTQARTALRAEMASNDSGPFARRVAYQPCMTRQIAEAQVMIDDLQAGRAPRKYTSLHTGVAQLFNDSEWQSQRASQVLTHFPRDELALMGRYYAQLENFRAWTENEGPAWADLRVLNDPPDGLTASDFLRLQSSLHVARRMNGIIVSGAERQLLLGRELGIAHTPVDPERVEKFCNTYDEAFAMYQRSLEPRLWKK
jgi:hypothetical protein